MRNTRREDLDGISGGRFVPASQGLLPPTRTAQIQGGRFVPASTRLLPPPRNVRLQGIGIDYEHAYHFSGIAGDGAGWNRSRE